MPLEAPLRLRILRLFTGGLNPFAWQGKIKRLIDERDNELTGHLAGGLGSWSQAGVGTPLISAKDDGEISVLWFVAWCMWRFNHFEETLAKLGPL